MSRPLLSLYRLDRPKLAELSTTLRALLTKDDRDGVAALLGLGDELRRRLGEGLSAVGFLLRADDDSEASPVFASLRRVAKRAALEHVWSSESPSLEGRLRNYDIIRAEPPLVEALDRLLNSERLPWFLQRPGGTGGWLGDEDRADLAEQLDELSSVLPDEINAFAEALGGMEGDALVHDRL